MKKLFLFLYSTFFFFNSAFSQNPLVKQWDYRFGGTEYDNLTCIIQTIDGGYLLGGYSYSDSSGDKTQSSWGNFDYWIVKIDSLGIKQWDKDIGGSSLDQLYSVVQTFDGGYILGGYSISNISGDKTQALWGDYDYWIVKIDSLGVKQWDKDFGGTSIDNLSVIQQTFDGGYIIGGYSRSGISGNKSQANWDTSGNSADYWIIKTDAFGYIQWDKDFGGTSSDYLYALQQTTDGGYILGGYSNSGISGDKTQANWDTTGYFSDYWIVKIDSAGVKQWDKDFGGTEDDKLFSLNQTSDGGYILGGNSISNISGDKTQVSWGHMDYWIVKTDSIGMMQWDRDFGGINWEDDFGSISQTNDKGYLISGTSYSNINGDKTEHNLGFEQTWVLKTDSIGNKQWDKTIFTTGHDEAGFSLQTKDHCYVMANYTFGGIGGYKTQPNWDTINITRDYWIIKFCDSTLTTSIPIINQQSTSFNIFPNPAQDQFTISGLEFPVQIKMVDVFGREVFQKQISASDFRIPTSDFANGIYIIKAYTDKGVFQRKLLIAHP
jgi:hypothetical protein